MQNIQIHTVCSIDLLPSKLLYTASAPKTKPRPELLTLWHLWQGWSICDAHCSMFIQFSKSCTSNHPICIASIIESVVINFKISIYIKVSDVFWEIAIMSSDHPLLTRLIEQILCFPHETWKICCQMFWWGASLNTVCISVCWQTWRARWNECPKIF